MTTADTSWIVIKGFKRLAGFQKCYRIKIFPKIPINANKKYRVAGRIPIQKKVKFNNTATSTIITTTTSDPSYDSSFSPPPPSPISSSPHSPPWQWPPHRQVQSSHNKSSDSALLISGICSSHWRNMLFSLAESALLIGGICSSHWRNCIFIGPCLSTHCGYHSCHSFASVQSWWSVWAFLKCAQVSLISDNVLIQWFLIF